MKLIDRPVKRLFAFGCSFTKYEWSTWPQIVGYDLNIPVYNFGKSGGGNHYIANMISQADQLYQFTEDDLIMVSWTNVAREDRWVRGQWQTPGNIYTQGMYDKNFVMQFVDPLGCLIRDLAYIKLVNDLLKSKKCQYHMFSMCDIVNQIDQSSNKSHKDEEAIRLGMVTRMYQDVLNQLRPSFFETLWQNNLYENKSMKDKKIVGDLFSDGHPFVEEHLKYLQLTFEDHSFRRETIEQVSKAQTNLVEFFKKMDWKFNRRYAVYELDMEEHKQLKKVTEVKQEEELAVL